MMNMLEKLKLVWRSIPMRNPPDIKCKEGFIEPKVELCWKRSR